VGLNNFFKIHLLHLFINSHGVIVGIDAHHEIFNNASGNPHINYREQEGENETQEIFSKILNRRRHPSNEKSNEEK